jgi:hypothetical protein
MFAMATKIASSQTALTCPALLSGVAMTAEQLRSAKVSRLSRDGEPIFGEGLPTEPR